MHASTPTHHARVAVIALAALMAGLADTAAATTYHGQISDPVEHPADPSRDVTNISTTFDNANGRWEAQVTFAAAPTAATSARLYLAILPNRAQCPLGAGGLGMRLESGGTSARYDQTCTQGTPQAIHRSLAGRTLNLQVSDRAAIGLRPTQLAQTRLSRHAIYDYVPATRLFAPDAPATLRVGPNTRFRIAPTGKLNLPLTGVPRVAHASVRLVAGTTVLARRTLTVQPGLPYLRLRVLATARRHLRANLTKATLKTTLTDITGQTRSITQQITILK